MRDGVKLFTSIHVPKGKSKTYPILMQRTCYSVRPYGEDKFKKSLGPSKFLMEDGYGKLGKIGCTQPRRVAAMSEAARVA